MRRTTASDTTDPLTIPPELWAKPVEVPHEWVVTAPKLPLLDRLLPLLTLICGYASALSAADRHATLASTLLTAAFGCVLRHGYAAIRYGRHALRFRRWGGAS